MSSESVLAEATVGCLWNNSKRTTITAGVKAYAAVACGAEWRLRVGLLSSGRTEVLTWRMLSSNPLVSPSRCSWEWDCSSFCASTNLITERESWWEPFIWTLTPPFLSPSPSPQRATCVLHNSLSQNKRHIWAAGRRMACLSRRDSSSMTPWKPGLVVCCTPLPWTTPTPPPTDR